jgi:hypothetical protein
VRVQLLPEVGRAVSTVDIAQGDAVLQEAISEARDAGDRSAEWRARIRRELQRFITVTATIEDTLRSAEQALEVFDELGDELGKAYALEALIHVDLAQCQWERIEEVARRLIEHARNAGALEREYVGRYWVLEAIEFGPKPVQLGINELDALLSDQSGPFAKADTMAHLAVLRAMNGEPAAAEALWSSAREAGLELGADWEFRGVGARIAMLADRPEEAEPLIRARHDSHVQSGRPGYVSTTAAELAGALAALGRDDEADELTKLSEETAAADDVISQVLWRKVRAGLLARRGSFDDAERLATEAVRAVERTDMLDLSGDVLLTLADVLRLAGRPREAAPAA